LQLRPLKSWLAEHRLVWPALLSIGGSILPFVTAWSLEMATTSEDTGARFAASIFLIYLGVALLTFSIVEFVGWDHRRVWGSVVACLYGFYGFVVLGSLYPLLAYSYRASILDVLWFLSYISVPVAGFLGGLFGVFWKGSWRKAAVTPGIAGASRRILVGGSILLVLELPFLLVAGYFGWIFSIPALLVVVCGGLLYNTRWSRRALGLLSISSSLVAGIPFYGLVIEPAFNMYTVWAIVVLGGIVLTITGALQAIRRKQIATGLSDSGIPF
jgi:hypothetical protein